MSIIEGNIDGLVGPTHHYGGLAFGNVASAKNAGALANPKLAALQGLAKMKRLHSLGLPQMVFPPHPRPNLSFLRRLGFAGDMRRVISTCAQTAPELLSYAYSASGMWAANAATVAASADTQDGRVHFTPANLIASAHRAQEAEFTARVLRRWFADTSCFAHHEPLPAVALFPDEGAANHMRLQMPESEQGIHVFVYGRAHGDAAEMLPKRFPARQALAASEAVARLHGLHAGSAVFVRQNPQAIDTGVFHNDVIAVSHENVLLYHERAFADSKKAMDDMRGACGEGLVLVEVTEAELSLEDAVASYLFNSQIVTKADGSMVLIAPVDAQALPAARACIERIVADAGNPIVQAEYMDVRQSMRNGGGPACLRLRLPLTETEWERVYTPALYSESLHIRLEEWVERHYRDRLAPDDLRDPAFAEEVFAAYSKLETILGVEGLYDLHD